MSLRQPNSTERITELQTLRGLAALVVAISHISSVYELPKAWRVGFDVIFNSHAAVILFFVLSGYVLSGSLLRTGLNVSEITKYYFRRLFRIYPAIWVASALSLWAILAVGSNEVAPAPSDWFLGSMLPAQMSFRIVLLSFLGVYTFLIAPVWTILVELVGSFFLPLFVWLTAVPWLLLPVLIILAVVEFLFVEAPHHFYVFSYLFFFALGASIIVWPARVCRIVKEFAFPIALISLPVLICFRAGWFVVLTGEPHPITYQFLAPLPAFVEGLSSATLIAAIICLSGRLQWLVGGTLGLLGDISYSFYLLHFPIMSALARTLSPLLAAIGASGLAATAILAATALTLTYYLSLLMYRFVECRGIMAGKRFGLLISFRVRGAI